MHEPIEHELFIAHTPHAWPPAPHWVAFCEPKGTQRLPWQQPLGHEVGVQVATVVHCPFTHVAAPEHGAHAAAPSPHAPLF